jgi:oligopeptide transport system ATP-binding protein
MKIDFEKEPPLIKITETHAAATWLLHPDSPKVKVPTQVLNNIKLFRGGDK